MVSCTGCGQQNPDGFRFCGSCGAPLDRHPAAAGEVRKTITVVFCDLAGSTALGERLDPESLQRVLGRYFEQMRAVLERHQGTVAKFIGDAVVGVFGIPRVHEDDALRAARAAVELGAALAELNTELARDWGVTLQLRCGVNTGEVVAGNPAVGSALVLGDMVNVAARLEQAAGPGEVLLGQATWRLVGDAVQAEPVAPLAVRGKAERVAAWRLLAVTPEAVGHRRRRGVALVGRESEQRLLLAAFHTVQAEGACRLVTVLGAAGVGKTRLVDEALAGIGERATVLRGRCLSYGEGITYWPVAEVVRQAAGIARDDAPQAAHGKLAALLAGQQHAEQVARRIASIMGLADAASATEEILWAVRELLAHLAGRRPLVVAVDDLHWAEPTLLDLVEYLASFSPNAPLLLLGLARTELLDARPGWCQSAPAATTVRLEPLTGAEAGRLVTELLGMAGVDQRAQAQITARAGGNPLFIEELVAKLIDDGLLRGEDGRWTVSPELDRAGMPATIQVLLAARLEQLPADERGVLQRASVLGKRFSFAAVATLAAEAERDQLGSRLAALVRRDLLRQHRPELAGEDAFEFRHDLIRDAAYQALPKRDRAELHARVATWLQHLAGEGLADTRELLGYHLEQAYRCHAELGPPDDRARRLARAAAEQLAAAGQRALARDDAPGATNLLGRAVGLLGDDDPARLQLLPDLGTALIGVDELEQAAGVLGAAATAAKAGGAERLAWRASLDHSWLRFRIDPGHGSAQAARAEAEQAIARLTELDDALALAKAWLLLGEVHNLQCRFAAMREAAERAIADATRAGALRELHQGLGDLLLALRMGPTPVAEALQRCQQLVEQASADHFAELSARLTIAALKAMQGSFPQARTLLAQVGTVVEHVGLAWAWPFTLLPWYRAELERLAGNPPAAERGLRVVYEQQRRAGDEGYLATTAVELAEVLAEQGHGDEALELTQLSEAAAAPDDLAAQLVWRRVRARVLAPRGQLREAERLAREAVRLGEQTDWLQGHGDALLDLAAVLRLAGRTTDAAGAVRHALALYGQKGNLVLAGKARRALHEHQT